jgi:outer membrane protein assembly factor BamD (BamD/ComL family)
MVPGAHRSRALALSGALCYKKDMGFFKLPGLLLLVVLAAGCASGPAKVSDTITPAELEQKAQEASDRNRYKQSLGYYEIILERFPDRIEYVCAAEYEIAFIHYKQKKYELSESELRQLLARYDGPDSELLPPQYRILANIVIAKIDEWKP